MKRSLSALLGFASLCLPVCGQVTVDLVATSGAPVTVGSPITFDVNVQDATGTVTLDSYEITLQPETLANMATTALGSPTFALPSALAGTFTLDSSVNPGAANADAPGDDLTISATPTTILTATFTPQAAGAYQIESPATGTAQENLYTYSASPSPHSTPISFTALGTTVTVVPEPGTAFLVPAGLALLFVFARRLSGRMDLNW